MKKLIALLVVCLFTSCGTFLDEVKLPRDKPQAAASAIIEALQTPDLDKDGTVNGNAEWEAFIRAAIVAYRR